MKRVFVGLVAMVLATDGCGPAANAGRHAAGPAVRFVRDTLIEQAYLPIRGESWSPSGRLFIAETRDGIRMVEAESPGRSEFFPLSVAQRSFAWSPGDSVLACHLRFGARSGIADSVLLLRPEQQRELVVVRWDVGSLLWLPTGALLLADLDAQYSVLRPSAASGPADTCERIWATHADWNSGVRRLVGLMPTICAPESSSLLPGVPGWSRVSFGRTPGVRMWWASRTRQFVTQYSDEGLLHFDATGRFLFASPPRERGEAVFTLASGGDVAIGYVDPDPDSQAGPFASPAYAWSGDGRWRSPISGLEGGIYGASAASVGDRILFQTKRGLELGRLVIDR